MDLKYIFVNDWESEKYEPIEELNDDDDERIDAVSPCDKMRTA